MRLVELVDQQICRIYNYGVEREVEKTATEHYITNDIVIFKKFNISLTSSDEAAFTDKIATQNKIPGGRHTHYIIY